MKKLIVNTLRILIQAERLKLAWLIITDLIMSVLDVAFLGMLLLVVNFYTSGQPNSALSALPGPWANQGSLILIGSFAGLFVLKNLLGFLNTRHQQAFFYSVASRLSERNIRAYFKYDFIRYVNADSSELIRRVSQQPVEFSTYVLTNLQQVFAQSILILVAVTGILIYKPGLFCLLLLLLVPPVMLLSNYIRHKLKVIRQSNQQVSQKTIQYLQESLSAFVDSRMYQKDDFFASRYIRHQSALNNNLSTLQSFQGLTARLVEVFAVGGFFILLIINKLSAGTPLVSLLTIGIFMAAAYKIIPGMVKILNSASQIKTYQYTIDALQPEDLHAHNRVTDTIRTISFKNIRFRYYDRYVLYNLNLDIAAGDMVGISSASGTGKTTMINLLLGFLQQQDGSIYINGHEAGLNLRRSFVNRISYVKQQPFLINDTLLKNITLSDDEPDDTRLRQALSVSGSDKLIDQHPDGVNVPINENGKNISGGQRQRLMLARALYHDFDVLILDEAFSEMDEESERQILEKLKRFTTLGKIIILITHHKHSLDICNKLVAPHASCA